MMATLRESWTNFSATPLFGLTLTLGAYQIGVHAHRWTRQNPLVNPVLLAIVLLVPLLWWTGVDYQTYFSSARFIHFLLGPATVALAVPLFRQVHVLKRSLRAVGVSLLVGSCVAMASAAGIAWALGATRETILSLAPKSVTIPIAMAVAEKIGGIPSLTASFVMLTGIIGAMVGPWILNRLGVRDWRAQGLAMGVAAHGIGTARALQLNELAGAFSGLGMGLNGFVTAVILPTLVLLWG
jgi:predicted murein hydrolase (TIGR00659 family)